jgi:GNAT superfamily N-acetyltransferase
MSCPETVVIEPFDPASMTHPAHLYRLVRAYMVDEFNRTRAHPFGHIAALPLVPVFICVGGKVAGVVSVDPARRAAETIYVEPKRRGRGVATQAMLLLRERHGIRTIKGPLSPASANIPERVGAVVDYGSGIGLAVREGVAEQSRVAVLGVCSGLGHKAARVHGQPCSSCYRRELGRASDLAVTAYLRAARMGQAAIL